MIKAHVWLLAALLAFLPFAALAQTAGTPGVDDLTVAAPGAAPVTVAVSSGAGPWEKRGASDLIKYIGLMTGTKPALADTPAAVAAALRAVSPVIIVGDEALKAEPSLKGRLAAVAKKDPVLRADAIVTLRRGSRIYVAGTNDESHYYAVSALLQAWGCRWYVPTEFGECIPDQPTLKVGRLDAAYAPPFEVRHYWLSWRGSSAGEEDFQRRNFKSSVKPAGMSHALGQYTQDIVPPGKTIFNVPFAEEATAKHVAEKIAPEYAKGTGSISLAIEDGTYSTDSLKDEELRGGLYDKYFQRPLMTDPMMTFYNNVARLLREQYPASRTRLGGLAYANVTLPPQREFRPEKSLVMWLAPIDVDPNHGMDDPNSPPRQEYREMLSRWSQIMEGRIIIYDYDQGMLVWRDIPDPSQFVFAQDVKHYRQAGILGIGTESRGATATTFLNLFFRGQLTWNPDGNVDAMLADFYPKFYGPAAAPMTDYWNAIFQAWKGTLTTEHEAFAAPAIYTPQLIAGLQPHLEAAEALMAPLAAKADPSRNEKLYLERLKFTRLSYDVLSNYVLMEQAAGSDCDYKAAVAAGERALAAREDLTKMNDTFTTYKQIGESGPSWWPGEVQQYRDLGAMTDGSLGTLIEKTPLEWAFHRDPHDTGLARGWAYSPVDLTYWKAHGSEYTPERRKDYPDEWELLRNDLYMQGQGIRFPDNQSFTDYAWYRTELPLKSEQGQGNVHLRFPGLFNECWLYVNGALVAHRSQDVIWWLNDYKFEWDVDLTGKLRAGTNTLTVRLNNPHQFGGLFRRPFLYRPNGK